MYALSFNKKIFAKSYGNSFDDRLNQVTASLYDVLNREENFGVPMKQALQLKNMSKTKPLTYEQIDKVITEKKSNTGIDRMVSMIEPLFTLVVGLIVGVIIVAMAMPIFDMSSLIG